MACALQLPQLQMDMLCATLIGEDLPHAVTVRAISVVHCLHVCVKCVSLMMVFSGERQPCALLLCDKLLHFCLFTAICPGTCHRDDFMSICADDNCAKGECEDHDGDKSCSCNAGWTGETCETGMFSTG